MIYTWKSPRPSSAYVDSKNETKNYLKFMKNAGPTRRSDCLRCICTDNFTASHWPLFGRSNVRVERLNTMNKAPAVKQAARDGLFEMLQGRKEI